MKTSRESYLKNMIEGNLWWTHIDWTNSAKPVDRSEWNMTPQTYNAGYNPSNNDIELPAAQMVVPGFKDEDLMML